MKSECQVFRSLLLKRVVSTWSSRVVGARRVSIESGKYRMIYYFILIDSPVRNIFNFLLIFICCLMVRLSLFECLIQYDTYNIRPIRWKKLTYFLRLIKWQAVCSAMQNLQQNSEQKSPYSMQLKFDCSHAATGVHNFKIISHLNFYYNGPTTNHARTSFLL